MSEEDILEDIIEDYERILGIVTNRLNQLKTLKKRKNANIKYQHTGVNHSVGDLVAEKRRQVMADIEKMKAQAREQARKTQEEADKKVAEIKAMPNFPNIELPIVDIEKMKAQAREQARKTQEREDKKNGR